MTGMTEIRMREIEPQDATIPAAHMNGACFFA